MNKDKFAGLAGCYCSLNPVNMDAIADIIGMKLPIPPIDMEKDIVAVFLDNTFNINEADAGLVVCEREGLDTDIMFRGKKGLIEVTYDETVQDWIPVSPLQEATDNVVEADESVEDLTLNVIDMRLRHIKEQKLSLYAEEDNLMEQRKKLVEEMKQTKENPVRFKQGETYFTYAPTGEIMDATCTEPNAVRLNAYKTKKEAEKAIIMHKAIAKVAELIFELNDGWEPNWKDVSEIKYSFAASSATGKKLGEQAIGVISAKHTKTKPNWLYCKSHEIAQKVLETYPKAVELICKH